MEQAYLLFFASLTLLSFGFIFPAYASVKSGHGQVAAQRFWLVAVIAQLASNLIFLASLLGGWLPFQLGHIFQVLTDIFLLLLFRSLRASVTSRFYAAMIVTILIYAGVQFSEDYFHRNIASSVLLIFFFTWQIVEVLRDKDQRASIYLRFVCLMIGIQIALTIERLYLVLKTMDQHGTAMAPYSFFQESLEAAFPRILVISLYILIFQGLSNHFFNELVGLVRAQKKELEMQVTTVLTRLAAARDNDTGKHLLRTQAMAKVLAETVSKMGGYRDELSDTKIRDIHAATPLHDLGKVAIPDRILNKPGRLGDEELAEMRRHAEIGEHILAAAIGTTSNPILETAMRIAGAHHERWDGQGYPRGLQGDQIPLEARIMSLIDVYDALTSRRIYKDHWSHDEAVRFIQGGRATQFDPFLVDAFLAEQETFRVISEEMRDPEIGV